VKEDVRARAGDFVRRHGPVFLGYGVFVTFALFVLLIGWYIQSQPVNTRLPWPTWELLKGELFRKRTAMLADTGWHVGAVMNGYEGFPRDVADPYVDQHNWTYFPATIYAGKLINIITRDVWWALQLLSLFSCATLLTMLRAARKAAVASKDRPSFIFDAAVVFFALPIMWPAVNFTVFPMLLEYGTFFAVLRLAREGATPSKPSLALVAALALVLAFARPQGLVIDAVLAVGAALFLREPPLKVRAFIVASFLVPILCLLLFYKVEVGQTFAWYHAQRAWGRRFTFPWELWGEELKSGFPFNIYASYAVVGFRTLIVLAGLGYSAHSCWKDFRGGNRSPLLGMEAWILAITLLLAVQPFTSGTILGAHRYLCFAMFPFLSPTRNPLTRFGEQSLSIVLLSLVFVRVVETVFLFENAYFAIW
jgi:hypothetical protein